MGERRSQGRRIGRSVAAAAMVVLGVGQLALAARAASAQAFAPLVTDYGAYPAPEVAGAPAGCDGDSFVGARFTTSGGDSAASLGALGPLRAGEDVTFTWTGLAPGCDENDANVTLVVMSAPSATFGAADVQPTVAYETAPARAGSVTLTMPALVEFGDNCRYHLDAVMGYALAEVGPNGSYYSAALRNDNERSMLASARVGQYASCIETVTTSSTSTTVLSTTSTTATPPPNAVTSLVALPTVVLPPTTQPLAVAAVDLFAPPRAAAQPTIPTTGAPVAWTAASGLACLIIGIALVASVTFAQGLAQRHVEPVDNGERRSDGPGTGSR